MVIKNYLFQCKIAYKISVNALDFVKTTMNELNDLPWDYPDPFFIKRTVTPDEVDGYNHVNNTVYLKWMDECAWKHSEAVGLGIEQCQDLGKGMAVTRHEIDYLVSVYLGDEVIIGDWVTLNDSKLRAERTFQIIRLRDNKTVSRCVSSYVCTNLKNGRPTRMPLIFVERYKSIR